jgi:hypothetical protein
LELGSTVVVHEIPPSVEYAAEFEVSVVLSTLPAIATKILLPKVMAVHPLLSFRSIGILVAAQPTGVGVVGIGVVGIGVVGDDVQELLASTHVKIPPFNCAE